LRPIALCRVVVTGLAQAQSKCGSMPTQELLVTAGRIGSSSSIHPSGISTTTSSSNNDNPDRGMITQHRVALTARTR
jgi:hypothetical protein